MIENAVQMKVSLEVENNNAFPDMWRHVTGQQRLSVK